MALPKQNLAIPFAVTLDQLTDPQQLQPGSFTSLVNAVFNKDKKINKRNGYTKLAALPTGINPTTITTFKNNLTVIGDRLEAYSEGSNTWLDRGRFQPVDLTVRSLYRSSRGQTQCDMVVGSNELCCIVFRDSDNLTKYQINDSTNSQRVYGPISLTAGSSQGRVFFLGNAFVVTYIEDVAGTYYLKFISIPLNTPTSPNAAVTVASTVASATAGYDGCVNNSLDRLYLAWNATSSSIRVRWVADDFSLGTERSISGSTADKMSVSIDETNNNVWLAFVSSSLTYALALNSDLVVLLGATLLDNSGTMPNITSTVDADLLTVFVQKQATYSFSAVRTDYIQKSTCTISGTTTAASTVLLGLGLGSKPFRYNSRIYLLGAYQSAFQPSYFLIDSTGDCIAKLAAGNGGGYCASQVLSNVSTTADTATIAYLYKSFVAPVNKNQNADSASPVYNQTGVNMATFDLSGENLPTAEIGNNLHIAGGFLWMYDGSATYEHNFHLYPEDFNATWSATGGSVVAQPDGATNANAYAYQITYEWTDAQGNVHRSAPSVPLFVTTTGSGNTGSIALNIPTLRITYKSLVRIVIYRWSLANQQYYMVTSITSPTLNSTSVNSVAYTDTLADASIVGNNLIYTTGGVVENIAAPACKTIGLFKSRLFLVNAENPDQLWYSKQVIQSEPVEMSDLFTLFVAPTTGASGSTGETKAIFPMDDKLICFKPDAMYYIVGNGPDNTGANNDLSDAVYITGTVGSSNQPSCVLIPQGIMFQSAKGIWLLGRDLGTDYLGAPVDTETLANNVTSALAIPGTDQVRFTLDSGITLHYDYLFNRWSIFNNLDAISSTIFNNVQTYIRRADEAVMKETPGVYLDDTSAVLMSFTTSWINMAGLQGFERAYFVHILGNYATPHTLNVSVAYDYNPSPVQSSVFSPDNFGSTWGYSSPFWGQDGYWGTSASLEQFRVFLARQKCQAVQITVEEQWDPSLAVTNGAGLSFSGLNFTLGLKKGYTPLPASKSIG